MPSAAWIGEPTSRSTAGGGTTTKNPPPATRTSAPSSRPRPDKNVYVFGYPPASYVYANRRSASRFFWSRPVILDFNSEDPGYGVPGLRADLERGRPAYVVLQQHDWSPDVQDSGPFFMA